MLIFLFFTFNSTFNIPKTRRVITETYSSGTEWYRVYSDGWCEQGGHLDTADEVSFLKNFANVNYTVLCGGSYTVASANANSLLHGSKHTTSSLHFLSYPTFGSYGADWQVCGYISNYVSYKDIIKY